MADFVELGAEGINHLVDKHYEKGYDRVREWKGGKKTKDKEVKKAGSQVKGPQEKPTPGHQSEVQSQGGRGRRTKNELPPPETERGFAGTGAAAAYDREDSLERESRTTESVKNAYESERDDPIRPVDPALERKYKRDSGRMGSYANGYVPYQDSRPRSQPPRDKYYEDEDSDYDERSGRRYRTAGRGYDDEPYDREVIETERYRGVSGALVPARPYDARRLNSGGARDGPYGAGAVAPYRRSQNDLTEVSRRSGRKSSRGRRDRYSDEDDYSDRDRSRSDSRGKEEEGWRSKVPDAFDPSLQGLGVALAGAAVGGLAGREFGNKHKQRDVIIGALVGGIGANLAENKYKEYREKKTERKEERWENKWDGRSRSNNR